MPYAEPTSPIPSPVKEYTPRRRHITPAAIDDAGPSFAAGPMPGIPRRLSSNHAHPTASGHTTPRRGASPAVSRQPSGSHQFSASRPMEGLPRRMSAGQGVLTVSGLPNAESSLGLNLYPSPAKPGVKSMKDAASGESSSSTTPIENIIAPDTAENDTRPTATPAHEPPPRSAQPARSALSPSRPTLLNSRRPSLTSHHRTSHTGSLQIFPHSSSTSHLPVAAAQSESSHRAPLRPVSMIRKKSGEVVKPSLKQRSMSTPDLSRQGAEDPTTPDYESQRDFPEERSKSVRFAGMDEGDDGELESVVLFLREQKPIAVGKAADPNQMGQMTETETENDTDVDFVQFRTRRNAAARAADETDRIQLEGGSKVPRLRVDFSPDAQGSLRHEHVVLERVELQSGQAPLLLKGTAIVRNVAFQKWVAVRFTMDHWQTVSEVSASHVCHIPSSTTGDEGWDRFSFSIKLDDFKRKLDERQLVLCVHFWVDGGRDWWDSNDGINYNFTFKKALPPRRPTRTSMPPALGSGFMRLNEPAQVASLPGLRQHRSVSPVSKISRELGRPEAPRQPGPRNWVFPKFAGQLDGPPSRPDSPMLSPPPPASFMAPPVPDAHSHLSLSKYCAPSPPHSPYHTSSTDIRNLASTAPLVLNAPDSSLLSPDMNLVGGQFATLSPTTGTAIGSPSEPVLGHDRRSSWNGAATETWDSFSKAMADSEATPGSTDGESTPTAKGSRSPMAERSSSDSSPEHRPLMMKRSTGDLRALMSDDAGLITPPSSTLSSPPSPGLAALPGEPMSPSPSMTSTGESSPINTISSESTPDLSSFPLHIDPDEQRGRPGHKMLTNSYQEFLDKFCFFQSPRMTPNEDPVYSRTSFVPGSGHASPSGFPFFHSSSSNSPRGTPTPTRQYDSAQDAFGFASVPMPIPGGGVHDGNVNGRANGHASGPPAGNGNALFGQGRNTTPRGSPQVGSPGTTPTPVLGAGFSAATEHAWAKHLHDGQSPSLAAAK